MSDTTSKAKSDAASFPSVKCGTKFTMKGFEFYAKTCQEKKTFEMQTSQKVHGTSARLDEIYWQGELNSFRAMRKLMTCMNERQNKYFYAKTTMFCDSTEDVKVGLSNVGRPYVQSNGNNIEPPDNQSVFSD